MEEIKQQKLPTDKICRVQPFPICQLIEKESAYKVNCQDSLIGLMLSFESIDFDNLLLLK